MDLLSIPVSQIVDHHPWIHNRFMVKPKFYKIIIPKIIDILEQISGCSISIETYNFDLNNQPILCLWLDCKTNIRQEASIAIKHAMAKYGLDCATWWDREKDCTRISIWRAIPRNIVVELSILEHQWKTRSKKAGASCLPAVVKSESNLPA